MIYEPVSDDKPIQQGDIFRDLPRIDISLDEMVVLDPGSTGGRISTRVIAWTDAFDDEGLAPVTETPEDQKLRCVRALLPVCPVNAIVITQNCDCLRADDLSLCEIAPLARVFKGAKTIKSSKSWAETITKQGTDNLRWFYLPPDDLVNFSERMAVDFRNVLRLPRPHVQCLKSHRQGRLSDCKEITGHIQSCARGRNL